MIRKVDGLGRIVIPKEVRKMLVINEDDSLVFSISGNTILLNKYKALQTLAQDIEDLEIIILTYIKRVGRSGCEDTRKADTLQELLKYLKEAKRIVGSIKALDNHISS